MAVDEFGQSAALPVSDATTLVKDPVDGTKLMRIDVGAVSTATTRVLTMPDSDLDLATVVVGPASATDNAAVRFDGTTGRLVQNTVNGPFFTDAGNIDLNSKRLDNVGELRADGGRTDATATPTLAGTDFLLILTHATPTLDIDGAGSQGQMFAIVFEGTGTLTLSATPGTINGGGTDTIQGPAFVVLADGSGSNDWHSTSAAHAAAHLTGGADEIDGDKIDIDWTPSNYTPATTPSEADSVDNLTAHLYGIDQELASSGGADYVTTDVSSTPYTVLAENEILHITHTATAAVTINLRAAATAGDGAWLKIVDAGGNAGTNNVTIDGSGSETINGAETFVISADYAAVEIYTDGSNWFVAP